MKDVNLKPIKVEDMPEKLFTVGEASAQKKVSSTAIYGAIAEGRLPARRVLGRWAIAEKDLLKYEPTKRGERSGAKGRGGRPKGSTLSPEHKARIAAAQAARWERRKASSSLVAST